MAASATDTVDTTKPISRAPRFALYISLARIGNPHRTQRVTPAAPARPAAARSRR